MRFLLEKRMLVLHAATLRRLILVLQRTALAAPVGAAPWLADDPVNFAPGMDCCSARITAGLRGTWLGASAWVGNVDG
jgi:hypothetical protein